MREQGPVHWHEGMGTFVTVTHAAADTVLRDRSLGRIWRDKEPAELFPAFNLLHRTSMLENEPPTHTRLRRLVAGAFGRGHVERMRPWVEGLADRLVARLVDQLADGAAADLIASVAEPLPVDVIAELLDARTPTGLLRPWSNAIVKMYEYGRRSRSGSRPRPRPGRSLPTCASSPPSAGPTPGGDLISALVLAADGGDRLTQDELVGTCVLLLNAGHEATVNVIRQRAACRAAHPGRTGTGSARTRVCCRTAVEEMMRLRHPAADVRATAMRGRRGRRVRSRRGRRSPPCSAPPTATRRCSPIPTGSTSAAPTIRTSPSVRASTSAWARRWPASSCRPSLGALLRRLPRLVLAAEPERRPEFVIRGLRALEVAAQPTAPVALTG